MDGAEVGAAHTDAAAAAAMNPAEVAYLMMVLLMHLQRPETSMQNERLQAAAGLINRRDFDDLFIVFNASKRPLLSKT